MGELKKPSDAWLRRFCRVRGEVYHTYVTLKKPCPPEWEGLSCITYKGFSMYHPNYMWRVNTYGSKNVE